MASRFHIKTATRRRAIVRALSRVRNHGLVMIGPLTLRCALGRGGLKVVKREGDGATPIGTWGVRTLHYRADQIRRPRTAIATRRIGLFDGWCDAPHDRHYNRFIRHPYPASAERLWRDDHLYDLLLVIGHNDRPRRRGAGSAIFVHLARPGYTPTEGCIALSQRDMRLLLERLTLRSVIHVAG